MMKGALTFDNDRQAHHRIMADFLRAVEMITPTKAEEILAEKGDIPNLPKEKGGNGNGTDSTR